MTPILQLSSKQNLYPYIFGYALLMIVLMSLVALIEHLFHTSVNYLSIVLPFVVSAILSEIYLHQHQQRLTTQQIKHLAIGGNLAFVALLPMLFCILWWSYYSNEEKQLYVGLLNQSMIGLILMGIILLCGIVFNTFWTMFALTTYNTVQTKKPNLNNRERFLIGLLVAIFVIILLWGVLHVIRPLFDPYAK